MASFSTTATVDDPRNTLGDGEILPPVLTGGGDDRSGPGMPDYATRLRRARLGLLVLLVPIFMLFVSFTSAYIVRQGLPTLDPQTNLLVKDWIPIKLPTLLLVNTFVLLLSSLGMELARRQFAASGFYVSSTPSSSFVYLLTGTHAVHLMGGILALFVASIAGLFGRALARRSIVIDVTAWYWHFMAGLWVYILCLLEFAR